MIHSLWFIDDPAQTIHGIYDFSEKIILLNAKSTATDYWKDSHGVKLNYTNWGIGHPAQRDYLTLIGIKLVLIQNLLFKPKFSFLRKNHKNDKLDEFRDFYEFTIFYRLYMNFAILTILTMAIFGKIFINRVKILEFRVKILEFPQKWGISGDSAYYLKARHQRNRFLFSKQSLTPQTTWFIRGLKWYFWLFLKIYVYLNKNSLLMISFWINSKVELIF